MPFLLSLQLEERIDTLSKEGRASKSSIEAGHMQIRELKEELQQVRYVNVCAPLPQYFISTIFVLLR